MLNRNCHGLRLSALREKLIFRNLQGTDHLKRGTDCLFLLILLLLSKMYSNNFIYLSTALVWLFWPSVSSFGDLELS